MGFKIETIRNHKVGYVEYIKLKRYYFLGLVLFEIELDRWTFGKMKED